MDQTQPNTARQPRGIVKVNGVVMSGWVEFEVHNNNFSSADSFNVTFAAAVLPDATNAAWFASQQDMFVELFIGFPSDTTNYDSSDLKSWIYGQVDNVDYDTVQNTITVDGRDLARVFIDTKVTLPSKNLTSSQIVAQFAAGVKDSNGNPAPLKTQIQATTTPVGKFYEIDHVNVADERSQWDIMQYLANLEGFRLWVRGKTLYFQPAPAANVSTAYQLQFEVATDTGLPQSNVETIKLRRSLTVSRGIQVTIRSWNKKQASGFSVSYPGSVKGVKAGQATTYGGAQIYSKTIPNLTPDVAMQKAQAWYQQIISHEMKLDADLPGDNVLDITSVMRLTGTGTAFDQFYYPDAISRKLSVDGGYAMTVFAKNHATQSESGTI